MKRVSIFACLLLIFTSSCSLNSSQNQASATGAASLPTIPSAPGHTPIPTSAPRATVFAVTNFPTCSPDPVPPYQSDPLETVAPAKPEASSKPTLRSLAKNHNLYFGSATDPGYWKKPDYAALLAKEFNMVVPEVAMNWEIVHPGPNRYDFTRGDAVVAFAQANNMAVYGHTLVWDLMLPAWVTEGKFTRDEWIQILCKHIKTVVGHYHGQIYAWNVVNEPFTDDGLFRDTIWLRAIGPEYIAMALQWAHEADPQARLAFNEHQSEGLNAKSQAVFALAQGLLQRGIPLNAIGLQMHVWLWGPPTAQELAANMQRLADLGLQVYITEMDVRTQYTSDSEAQKMAAQADVYREALAACLNATNCPMFLTWGVNDATSWIPGYTGHPDAPLLFDENSAPKPAYYAILDLLSKP